jgi:hypothetical protein
MRLLGQEETTRIDMKRSNFRSSKSINRIFLEIGIWDGNWNGSEEEIGFR